MLMNAHSSMQVAVNGLSGWAHRCTSQGGWGVAAPPSQNEVGQIINVSRAKIGGNINFKKKTYVIYYLKIRDLCKSTTRNFNRLRIASPPVDNNFGKFT
jgi:hypothetical protein